MKKILFILCLTALLSSLALFAETRESEFYSVDRLVVQVSPHPLGYKITYYDNYAQLHDMYLPLQWFQEGTAGTAQIIYGHGETYPYVTFYFKNAELHHLRLYVFDMDTHPTWGTLSRQLDLTDEFDVTLETLEIEF